MSDVKFTLDFARSNGLRLTVKNGGHSFMGYCLNQGGIVLDISPMKACHVDYDKMLITMDAGLLWEDVYYKHLNDKRNIVMGAQCSSVGVSGFTLGGGISPFSRSYGLGCDNLLEMTIVTWDGQTVTVSREDKDEEKRELFWALAGGGGGNFGVTVSLTSRMHKLQDDEGTVVRGQLLWKLPQQQEDFNKMMDVFNSHKWPEELTIDALWSHTKNKQLTGGMTVIYNGGWEKAQEALKPLLAFNPSTNDLKPMKWTDCVHQSEGWDLQSQIYHHHASFVFAEGAITPELNTKISNLVQEATEVVGITDDNNVNDPKCHITWDHIGAATERRDPEDTPFYWRNGHYVSTIKMQWTNEAKADEILEFIGKCKAVLLPHAIEQKAAYLNYIDATVPNWEEAYYGRNYPRLQKVKTRWDPNNFFWNRQSIRPLAKGQHPMYVHGKLDVPSKAELRHLPQLNKMERWWKTQIPVAPRDLSSPETDEDVYQLDAEIRRSLLADEF